jgi:hypothetical protein
LFLHPLLKISRARRRNILRDSRVRFRTEQPEWHVMPFSMMSYFLGVGTVVGALALGFGGGIVLTKTAMKDTPAPNRIERAHGETVGIARSSPPATEAKAPTPAAQPEPVQAAMQSKPADVAATEPAMVAEPVRQIDTSKTAAEQPVQPAEAPKTVEQPVRRVEAPKAVEAPARQAESKQVERKEAERKEAEQRNAERERRRAEQRKIEREKRLLAERERKARAPTIVVRRQRPEDPEQVAQPQFARPQLAFEREEPRGGLFEGLFGRPAGDDRD